MKTTGTYPFKDSMECPECFCDEFKILDEDEMFVVAKCEECGKVFEEG